MNKTIILHIGAHKTGTTFLQSVLHRSINKLDHLDVGVVRLSNYWPSMQRYIIETELSIFEKNYSNDQFPIMELKREIEISNQNFIIVSNEDFSGTTKVQKITKLYPALECIVSKLATELSLLGKVKFVLSVREQSDFFQSCILQQIQQGQFFDIKKCIENYDLSSLSWLEFYKILVNLVGAENVLILVAEDCKEDPFFNTQRLLRWAIDRNEEFDLESPKTFGAQNPSFSQVAVDVALATRGRIKGDEWKKLRFFLRDNFSGNDRKKPELLGASLRNLIRYRFAQENKELFMLAGLDRVSF